MGKRNQIWAMCACNLYSMTAGTTLAWPSHGMPYLFDESVSPVGREVTLPEAAFVASALPLIAAIGTPVAHVLSHFIGAKYTILMSSFLFIVGYIVMATTTTVAQIILARAIWGFSFGAVYNSNRLYISQIAQDDIKDVLEMFHQFFMICGLTFTYILSPSSSFQSFCYIAIVIPISNIIFFVWFPESPEEYISTGNEQKAAKCLMFLRRETEERAMEDLQQLKMNMGDRTTNRLSMFVAVASPANKHRKFLCFIINASLALPLTGFYVFVFFAKFWFELSGGMFDNDAHTTLFGLTNLFASFFGMITIKIMNQKIVLLVSNIGCSICMFGLGGFFTTGRFYDLKPYGGYAVFGIMLYSIFFTIGYGTIIWSMICDRFSNSIDIFPSMLMSVVWCVLFVEVTLFFPLLPIVGADSFCYAFGLLSCYLLVVIHISYPSPEDWDAVRGLRR